MGRFHRHDGETTHDHSPAAAEHSHEGSHQHSNEVGDHSGYATGSERVDVLERIFDENDRLAAANRADLGLAGTFALNLMSSPGAGKTSLLQVTLRALRDELRIAVIEGDIETSLDADRLRGLGSIVELVNTGNGFGGECHLDAPMVRSALTRLPLDDVDLLIIENVGNLVCPAEFDVGEHKRIMVFSVTEGEDKPAKYPVMFRSADLVLVNKIDLLPHLDFDAALFERHLQAVNPGVERLDVSVRSGDGIEAWLAWLRAAVRARSVA